jgi:hypothetical protein
MDEASREWWGLTPARLRALYAGAVAGLVVFIGAALLFPAPIHSYSARAVLEQTALVGNQAPLELDLLTQPQVEQQAEATFLALAATTKPALTFQQAITCQVERPTPNQVRITFETHDRYADRSLELCRGVADDLVRNAKSSFVPGIERLHSERANVEQRLALVRQSKRAAEDELTMLTREHVSQVTSALQPEPGAERSSSPAAEELKRLEQEWEHLLAERSELARTKTDGHPQVKDIDLRLAEMKKRVAALTALENAAQAGLPPRQRALDSLQVDYRRRSLDLSEVIAADRRREEELLSEAARLAITPAPIALSTNIVEQPDVVERLGGQPSGFQVAVLLLLSITAGGLTYRLLRQWSAQQRFSSAEEIEEELDLPVITLAARYDAPASILNSRVVRRSLLAAEVGLAVVAVATFFLVAMQSELARPAAADPLGAVAEAMDRTFSPTFRR